MCGVCYMDEMERERCLKAVSRIVSSYMEEEDGYTSFREFARILNEGNNDPKLNVSYQTVKNWLDAVYLPRNAWLDAIEENAEDGSIVKVMAREIYTAIWSTRGMG